MTQRCGRLMAGRTWLVVLWLALGASGLAQGQTAHSSAKAAHPSKLGILPFSDDTGTAGVEAGVALSRALQLELTGPSLVARPIALDPNVAATDVDAESATAMGQRSKVDLVLVGAVLQATTSHSSKSGSIPFIKSQTGDVRIQSMKAHVALMGQLYNVATGELVATLKASGDHSDSKVSGDAYTSLGSFGSGSDSNFNESTLGKALQAAIVDLATKVSAAAPSPAAQTQTPQ